MATMIDLGIPVNHEMYEILCRWAISQDFDRDIALHLLAEELPGEQGEQLWARFEADFERRWFPIIRRTEANRYQFRPDVRSSMLRHWHSPGRYATFRQLHRRMHEYFETRFSEMTQTVSAPAPLSLLYLLTQSLYHLVAYDEEVGFQRFEQLFAWYEQVGDALACHELLATLEQHGTNLSQRRQLWIKFYKARLAGLHERLRASEGLPAIEDESSCATSLILEALLHEYHKLRQAGIISDPALEGWTWNTLGLYSLQTGKYSSAQRYLAEAIHVFERENLIWETIAASINLGVVYRESNQIAKALEVLHAVEEKLRDGDNPLLRARLSLNIALVYGDMAYASANETIRKTCY